MSNPFDWSCSMTLQNLPCRALLDTRKCEEYQKQHKKAARKVDSPIGSGAMGYVSTPSKGVLLSKRGSCWSSSGRKINTQHDYGCTPLMVAASEWERRLTAASKRSHPRKADVCELRQPPLHQPCMEN